MTSRIPCVGSRLMVGSCDDSLNLFTQYPEEFGLRMVSSRVTQNGQRHAAAGLHFGANNVDRPSVALPENLRD